MDRPDLITQLPAEIRLMILSKLDIRDWARLQRVSKAWKLYCTDAYLWSLSIDTETMPRGRNIGNRRYLASRIFQKIVDRALRTSAVQTIQYLRIADVNTNTAERCLEYLRNGGGDRYSMNDKFIDTFELELKSIQTPTNIENTFPVRDYSVTVFDNRVGECVPINLFTLLVNNQFRLEKLYLKCPEMHWPCANSVPQFFNLREIALDWICTEEHVLFDLFKYAPNLKSASFAIRWGGITEAEAILRASMLSSIESLEIRGYQDPNYGSSILNMNEEAVNQEATWPSGLTSLIIHGPFVAHLQSITGSLERLEKLCIGGEQVSFRGLLDQFQCEETIRCLSIRSQYDFEGCQIARCKNLTWLDLQFCKVNAELKSILTTCNKLQVVNTIGTKVRRAEYYQMARNEVKVIGIDANKIKNPNMILDLSNMGTECIFDDFDSSEYGLFETF